MKKKKRLLSAIGAWFMAMGLVLVLIQPASAEATKTGISALGNDVYDTLGIETDSEELREQAKSDLTPYGKGVISMDTINELVFIGNNGVGSGYDISDNDKAFSRWSETVKKYDFSDADAYRSVAFDPFGSGKANYIATVSAKVGSNNITDIMLSVDSKETSPDGDTFSPVSIPISKLPFKVYPENAGAWLSIVAGNFDGDDKNTQEIAVYRPYAGNKTYNSTKRCFSGSIEIFKLDWSLTVPYNSNNRSISMEQNIKYSLVSMGDYDLSEQSEWYFHDNFDLYNTIPLSGGKVSDWTYMYRFPALSMETISQPANDTDDLCITFCSPLGAGVAKKDAAGNTLRATRPYDCATGVFFWIDPLKGSKKTSTTYMRFNWSDDYKVKENIDKNATKKNEVMVFGGAGSGDLDGDGYQEVVVAGYLMSKRDQTMDGDEKDDWKISKEEYIATYFTYDPDSNTYTHVNQAPNWVSIKKADYFGASALGEGIYSNYGAKDMVHNMLPVTCFAERGSNYPDSVAIGGIICLLDTESDVSKWTPYSEKGLGNYSFKAGAFNPRYAIPTEVIHGTFDHGVQNRLFTETVAGNFDGNKLGLEQLAFVYIGKVKEESKWSSAYGLIGQRIEGEPDYAYNVKDKNSRYLGKDLRFNYWISQKKDKNYAPASVCVADIDNDSTLMRFSGKPNEYFFSDPHILAVLQAAPYFKDIDYVDAGATSIEFTEGTTSEEEHGLTVGMQIEMGASEGINLFDSMAKFTIMMKAGISSEFERTWGTGSTKSYALSYSAGEENSVALVMTPYVRYHYEAYDPKTKKWKPLVVDSPQSPRASLITTEKYDAVAKTNGWTTIEGNILNNTAGAPATYDSTTLGKKDFDGGRAVGANIKSNFIKVGSGDSAGAMAQTISAEETKFKNMSWNVSATLATEIEQGNGYIGISASAGYTGASSNADFSGYDYVGEVTNIPNGSEDYSFAWQFGVWKGNSTVQGEKQSFLVLGYLVKDVIQPPMYPANFHVVESTANTISLGWQLRDEELPKNLKDATYTLYRYHHGVYYPITSVDSTEANEGWFTFTDENVAPYQEYCYSLRTCVINSMRYLLSSYTPLLYAYTLPDGTVPIAELTQRGTLTVYKNSSRKLTVKVTPVEKENVGEVVLQWQRYERDNGGWQDIVGAEANKTSITIHADDAPERIRCQVSQRVGTEIFTTYTKELPVVVKTRSNKSNSNSAPVPTTNGITIVTDNDMGYAIVAGEDATFQEEDFVWQEAGSYPYSFEPGTKVTLWLSGDLIATPEPTIAGWDSHIYSDNRRYYTFTMPDSPVKITISWLQDEDEI